MKSSTQVIGLPVISIQNGVQLGQVKSLVVNPEKGTIDFLIVDQENWEISMKAIPFRNVIGIGEFAVTVEEERAVLDLNVIPIANELVNKKIAIKQAKVMTRKGQLLGEATEFYIDEETGQITGIEVQIGNESRIVRADHVITYGKELLIVHEDAQQTVASDVSELLSLRGTQVEPLVEQMTPKTVETELDELRRKQIDMLTGKRVLKDIVDANGQTLIAKDTILTKEHIIRAQEEGPDVVIELSMNVE
ncbi:photosystem reaction center subunit H [Anoxybacillus gonensis]|uniref:PRC-barrel domain-containing protein n=1 Tax=Anoxybacillus gonensis TaxID=198467 RepID=A0AAW7TFV5_9BACL|nr:PRC-barrel domain-containing protein [Anoxybacillus gonensis]AKS39098.1 photosystem reaction center subunit H [Anoxybacillus gonensis]KGP61223.1 photosystem reaction center subunit H [Anoxybacillus gonensis]MCX8047470.1 PRC-barrel domain-containing protein [Anoxybacillus gonensis]MDO0876865.1 PRC-barrel domain-containing protein [Anoxybacillus gonensis]